MSTKARQLWHLSATKKGHIAMILQSDVPFFMFAFVGANYVRPRAFTEHPYDNINLCMVFSFNFPADQVVKRHTIIIGKLYCRPQRKLSLPSLIPLVNGKLHIKQFSYLLLRFITIFSQITYSWIHKHFLTSHIVCKIII